MFEEYDLIRIINLPHRTDRKREMIAELNRVGVEVDGDRVSFFDAVATKDADGFYSAGARGCYLSHLAILEEAGERSVLVIEDDCDFSPYARHASVPECDIFHAGYMSEAIGAHLIGYSRGMAARVAAYLRQLLDNGERISFDGALVHFRRDHPEVSTVFPVPSLAFQRPSRTDIGQRNALDTLPFIDAARSVKRSIKRTLRAFA